ncbi:MAG: hypothetical protein P4L50_29915 [Anaerolineaceae bacterium]|nr:hypothetical protein [Anaerolineaceae bacterium]
MSANRKIVSGKLALLVCFIVNACTGMETGLASTRTPQSPATNLPTISFLQPSTTLTPSPVYTSTPHPLIVTATVGTPPSTMTPDPEDRLTEQASDLFSTQVASFSPVCDQSDFTYPYISPNGNWLAISCGYSKNQMLEVDSKQGKRWVLKLIDFLPKSQVVDGQAGNGDLWPVYWTKDEKYLYFTSYVGFDGSGVCLYSFGYDGLFRINLNDGTVTATLSESAWGAGYQLSYSPDGRRLAYTYESGPPAIVDLETGEKFTINVGSDNVGDLTWSPDGSQLAFATCRPTQDGSGVEKSSIKIFSLKTHSSKTVLEVMKNFLTIESQDGKQFLISNSDEQGFFTDLLLYNWSSGQLATVTPTPSPE